MKAEMTRKEFLQRLLFMGVGVVAGGALLESCSKEEETQTATPRAPGTNQQLSTAKDPCGDTTGLTAPELTMREETLKYVAISPDPNKVCDNCKFWTPAEEGTTCGGCTLIKGPINPGGYCTSWFTAET